MFRGSGIVDTGGSRAGTSVNPCSHTEASLGFLGWNIKTTFVACSLSPFFCFAYLVELGFLVVCLVAVFLFFLGLCSCFVLLRQAITTQLGPASSRRSSCFSLWSTGIRVVWHHVSFQATLVTVVTCIFRLSNQNIINSTGQEALVCLMFLIYFLLLQPAESPSTACWSKEEVIGQTHLRQPRPGCRTTWLSPLKWKPCCLLI